MELVLPTANELACIKHCESKSITDFYNKNLESIKAICYKHCAVCNCLDYFADCLNQVYIDLCKYNYNTIKDFYWGIRHSCSNACMFSLAVSLDKPITEDGATLSEIIPDKNISIEEQLINEEHLQESVNKTVTVLLDILNNKSHKEIKKADIKKLIVYLYPNLTDEQINNFVGEEECAQG